MRGEGSPVLLSLSGYSAQFRYSARLDPLHHEDVAFVIKASTVRANEPAGHKCSGSLISNRAPILF